MSSINANEAKPLGTASHKRPGLHQQIDVLHALVLHDIKSRFFGNCLGQVMLMVWPIIHIAVLMWMYYFSARVVSFGQNALLYCVTGVIPFIVFSYRSRWMVFAVVQNRPFEQYLIIMVLDIMLARAYLESQTACIVTVSILVVLLALGVDCWPNRSPSTRSSSSSSMPLPAFSSFPATCRSRFAPSPATCPPCSSSNG